MFRCVLIRRAHRSRLSKRERGQSLVEFGLVALIFVMLLFGIVDLGILLNGWMGVTNATRDLARQAAVGACPTDPNPTAPCDPLAPRLPAVSTLGIQGVDRNASTPIDVKVVACPTDGSTCDDSLFTNKLWSAYYYRNPSTRQLSAGTCTSNCVRPQANDSITVNLVAQIQVVTPLIRPFFGCTDGSNPRCDVPIASSATARFEGTWKS